MCNVWASAPPSPTKPQTKVAAIAPTVSPTQQAAPVSSTQIAALQDQITKLTARMTTLEARLAAIESASHLLMENK